MSTISTAYGYSSTIYPGSAKPADTTSGGTGTGGTGTAAPVMVATDLRQDVGVEVTLSPAALQLLAQQAAAATPDEETQITNKMKQILSAIFLESGKQAEAADKTLPPLTGDAAADTARKTAAQQASDFFDGKAANPFKGKTPAELAAVIVDKDGKYTVNERRAAYSEFARQDNARILTELAPPTTDFDKKVNDAEVPKSGAADRLASAKKATEFVNGGGKVKNPFADKTRDQLTAIIDNDTGDYTVNERRSALQQRDSLEKAVLAKAAKPLTIDERTKANSETIAGASAEAADRARSATRFLNGWDKANPFAGLSREELNAIVYDESKSYTTNEQRAAYAELKQYLPASALPADPAKTDTSKPATNTGKNGSKTDDPYNTGGAYNQYMMQQVMRSQNTQYLLGLLGSGSSGGSGMSLVNYLG